MSEENEQCLPTSVSYTETGKFNAWVSNYFNKEDKTTHLNATQSAIKAYGYNPVTEYSAAAITGHRNVKKVKSLASVYGEDQGLGLGQMIEYAIKQLRSCKSETAQIQWWDRLMELFQYNPDKEEIKIEATLSMDRAIRKEVERFK